MRTCNACVQCLRIAKHMCNIVSNGMNGDMCARVCRCKICQPLLPPVRRSLLLLRLHFHSLHRQGSQPAELSSSFAHSRSCKTRVPRALTSRMCNHFSRLCPDTPMCRRAPVAPSPTHVYTHTLRHDISHMSPHIIFVYARQRCS